jgi:hypothetical protein
MRALRVVQSAPCRVYLLTAKQSKANPSSIVPCEKSESYESRWVMPRNFSPPRSKQSNPIQSKPLPPLGPFPSLARSRRCTALLLLDLSKNTLSLNLIYSEQYKSHQSFQSTQHQQRRPWGSQKQNPPAARESNQGPFPPRLQDGFRKHRCAISGDQLVT